MDRELLRQITAAEISKYEEDGVVWLRGILAPKWVSLLDETIEEILAQRLGQYIDFTGLGLGLTGSELKTAGKWSEADRNWGTSQQLSGATLLDETVKPEAGRRGRYISATDTWKNHAAMRQLALASPVPKVAATLMRSQRIYLYTDQVLVKPPGTMEKTAWHSDQGYDHIAGEQVCGVRI
ncbi:MAG: phytanoyl-CoA dioxygenase family protein, partial [Candidatus Binataceae bacterium]